MNTLGLSQVKSDVPAPAVVIGSGTAEQLSIRPCFSLPTCKGVLKEA